MSHYWDSLKPTLLMIVAQVIVAGMNVLYKLTFDEGMSLFIIIAYRFTFATAFMVPLALVIEWNQRPKLTWMVIFQAFFCALFGGTLALILYLKSLELISATFASAIGNLTPAITFILSIVCRLEKLNIRSVATKAKIIGTIVGIGGAMVLTFYNGHEFKLSHRINILNHRDYDKGHVTSSHGVSQLAFGFFLAFGACVSYVLSLIIQTKMIQRYPCMYSITAIISLMGALQSIIIALCLVEDPSKWKLKWNYGLLTVVYSGIVMSGVIGTVVCWCVQKRGPLFVAIFSPLPPVMVAIAGFFLLDEKLYLGCIIGSVLILCGVYGVLWGKSKEMETMPSEVDVNHSKEDEHSPQYHV